MSVHAIPSPPVEAPIEHRLSFECFGGACRVLVSDGERPDDAAAAASTARRELRAWHGRFSRFLENSELSRLNRNPRKTVPITPLMGRLIGAGEAAAEATGGLVDATLGRELVRAGYRSSFSGQGLPLAQALAEAPPSAPALPARHSRGRWVVDESRGTVTRPPGSSFDPGGLAKGVFADELAPLLDAFDAYALDCAGDLRLGGRAGLRRQVRVASPFDDGVLHEFWLAGGAIATSGIGRRSWLGADGRPAHHLLNPRTGAPSLTGVVQATALAPSGAEAEMLAKAALLSGPSGAAGWLRHGGVFVRDDSSYEVVEPAAGASPAVSPTRVFNQSRTSASTSSRSGSLKISWNRPG
jgi:thiamine biosynthesis lipoprotein